MGGAASIGAALSQRPRRQTQRRQPQPASSMALPRPVSFREVRGRGLLVSTWVNGVGPFNFAVDTGAGATIISPHVAGAAGVSVSTAPGPSIAGLSGATVPAHDGVIRDMAIGDPQNYLPTKRDVIVSSGLPPDLDGLLDPNDAFGSLVLRNIPTDVISGAPAETPALLGLNALRPFRMRFDPLHRLIEIAPTER